MRLNETAYLILSLLAGSGAPYAERHASAYAAHTRFEALCRRCPSVCLYYWGELIAMKGEHIDIDILELERIKELLQGP